MENSYISQEPQQDLLTDLTINVEQADVGKRFVNYLVDGLVFLAFVFILFFCLALAGVDISAMDDPIGGRIIGILLYGIFMGSVEAIFKGKTVGKLFTRTRAVNEDGSRISARTAFIRGMSRAVPFNVFSAFNGYPWHDRWSHTYVIDETKSILPK
ncbi:MAG: RDD family protein [Bacteroidetes bacterium]|nr:RDD family protein [Bacteroidota bacterium]